MNKLHRICNNLKKIVLVSLLLVVGLLVVDQGKVYADQYFPDDGANGNTPGNGIPNEIEEAMRATCSSPSGPRTVHATWIDPYIVEPPSGVTSVDVLVRGASYVCPGVAYTQVSSLTYFNVAPSDPNASRLTIFGNTMNFGTVARGNYSTMQQLAAKIDFSGLAPGCYDFGISWSISGFHGSAFRTNTGLSYGSTVCFYPQPDPLPPITIRGRVFRLPAPGSPDAPLANVQIDTCGYGTPVTDANGFYAFQVPQGSGYCARAIGGPPAGTRGPFTRPWMDTYSSCPSYGPPNGSGEDYCGIPSYEFQVAGVANGGSDKINDEGLDIVFVPLVTVIGRVFRLPSSSPAISEVNYANIRIETCGFGVVLTDANGFYAFQVPRGSSYCAQLAAGQAAPAGTTGPHVRPYFEGYRECPNYPPPDPANNGVDYCATRTTYNSQVAGRANGGADRSRDDGLDIIFINKFDRIYDFDVPEASNAVLGGPEPDNPTTFTMTPKITGLLSAPDAPGGPTTPLVQGLKIKNIKVTGEWYIKSATGSNRNNTLVDFGFRNYGSGNGRTFAINDSSGPRTVGLNPPALVFGDRLCFTVTVNPTLGTMEIDGTIITITRGARTSPENCTGPIGDKPYFKVYGGDIRAGGAFFDGTVCTPLNGKLLGNYTAGKGGAGGQLAILAANQISGVGSASQRLVTPPLSPGGLTFANTGAYSVPSLMGGNFGQLGCTPDYFGTKQYSDARKATSTASSVFLSSLAADKQTLVTPGGGQLEITGDTYNVRHTIFVDGDAFISGNVLENPTPPFSVSGIPYLTLVVKGNIYISSNVTQLNGWYIAQPISPTTGGSIYTCRSTSAGVPLSGEEIADQCRDVSEKLTVNGAFTAKNIHLQRALGSVRDGLPAEPVSSPNIAEVFNGLPSLFIGRPVFNSGTATYDSIKSLPPVL